MIRKDDIFERTGRGLFALKEWSDQTKQSRFEINDSEDENGEPAIVESEGAVSDVASAQTTFR